MRAHWRCARVYVCLWVEVGGAFKRVSELVEGEGGCLVLLTYIKTAPIHYYPLPSLTLSTLSRPPPFLDTNPTSRLLHMDHCCCCYYCCSSLQPLPPSPSQKSPPLSVPLFKIMLLDHTPFHNRGTVQIVRRLRLWRASCHATVDITSGVTIMLLIFSVLSDIKGTTNGHYFIFINTLVAGPIYHKIYARRELINVFCNISFAKR